VKKLSDPKPDWPLWKKPDDLRRELQVSPATMIIALREPGQYRIVPIDRGPGKPPRVIFCPRIELKTVQRRVLRRILDALPLPDCVHSRQGRSAVSNAALHVGQQAVAVFDMQDFFPSIPSDRVHRLFSDIGFNRRLAKMLTRLTTAEGHLQQGPPTSPAVANLLAIPLDQELCSWCRLHGLNYSRYVDDLAISGEAAALIDIDKIVREAIERNGFVYSESKYHLMFAGSPQKVTGIVVNSGLQVAAEYVEAVVEAIDAFTHFAQHLPSDMLLEQYARVRGRIAFCRQVAPTMGTSLYAYLQEQAAKLPPSTQADLRKGSCSTRTRSSSRRRGGRRSHLSDSAHALL